MGMYTELHFNSELKLNTPDDIISILKNMVGDMDEIPAPLPNHPLFSTGRWRFMLRSDSYYFAADTHSTLRFDEIAGSWFLCIRTNLKNYGGEIEKFVSWIMPYLNKSNGDFLGFERYEETETPTLIYMEENDVALC
ncbi:hypothetical protein LCGC14_1451780 [marine sediment metagenome]|uniref:Uncharacterized protein n=1 Tax=marine sediment metagenome TaxID=412755 RepID=A0A0F9MJG7_9ZZZZ